MASLVPKSRPTWDDCKPVIKKLYVDDRNSVEQVMDIIRLQFEFTASKSSYERQLKTWGFQKKISQAHQEFLKLRLETRQQQNIESDIYVNGMLIPKDEIRKRIKRVTVGYGERMALVARCRTPEGLIILTPTSDSYMKSIRTSDLPWIDFQKQLHSPGTCTVYR
ncbi:isoform 3 of ankyrin-3 protein [Rutstroemia sp. NJR-2017a WRK4]|nr:isoform 3 of ankyrin-3 protein [Rutstroemia sp. NJR-2017a WRK4]